MIKKYLEKCGVIFDEILRAFMDGSQKEFLCYSQHF